MTDELNPYQGLSFEEWRRKIDKLERAKRDKNWKEWERIVNGGRGRAVQGVNDRPGFNDPGLDERLGASLACYSGEKALQDRGNRLLSGPKYGGTGGEYKRGSFRD